MSAPSPPEARPDKDPIYADPYTRITYWSERAQAAEAELRELQEAVKAVLDNGVLVEGGVLIADVGAATDLQIVYGRLAASSKEPG